MHEKVIVTDPFEGVVDISNEEMEAAKRIARTKEQVELNDVEACFYSLAQHLESPEGLVIEGWSKKVEYGFISDHYDGYKCDSCGELYQEDERIEDTQCESCDTGMLVGFEHGLENNV